MKRSARSDKRSYIEEMADEAEQAAAMGKINVVYKITKRICGTCNNFNQSACVKDKNGDALTTERNQAARWVQHFQEVLNRPEPDGPANPPPVDDALEINTSPPTEVKVTCRTAIKAMKSGKAPGIDFIHAEMLKVDIETSTKILTNLFTTIWTKDTIPADWTKGLIVKLPKKGDLQNANNWRGITLLSVPCKVFCRVLLLSIEAAIDSKLRQEQEGFRKSRGCIEQIFALRLNITEQCLECNTQCLLHVTSLTSRRHFTACTGPLCGRSYIHMEFQLRLSLG